MEVIESSDFAPVAAGEEALGWLIVRAPKVGADGDSVLRLQFAADAKGTVEAMLVLPADSDRQEVANARAAGK